MGCFVSCYGGLARTVNVRVMYFKHEKLLVSSFKCHYYIKHILLVYSKLLQKDTHKKMLSIPEGVQTQTLILV